MKNKEHQETEPGTGEKGCPRAASAVLRKSGTDLCVPPGKTV